MKNSFFRISVYVVLLSTAGSAAVQAADEPVLKSKAEVKVEAAAAKKDAAKTAAAAKKEAGKAAEAAKAAAVNPAWKKTEPKIVVSKWGSEIKIVVTPSPLMKKEEVLAIQSVKLESDKGEFLGLKTYSPEETDRSAEFSVNPEILKIDAVRVIVTSQKAGEWAGTASLVIPDPTLEVPAEEKAKDVKKSAEAAGAAAVPAAGAKSAPKKKGWLW